MLMTGVTEIPTSVTPDLRVLLYSTVAEPAMRCDVWVQLGHGASWSKGARSPEVSLRKRATGPGLQIAFELDSPLLVRELDGDVELPRAVARGVGTAAGVVVGEAGGDIGRKADVWPIRLALTAQDIDGALG
jgi:hypothetical protein